MPDRTDTQKLDKRDLKKTHRLDLTFEEGRYLPLLYGEHDRNLITIATRLDVAIRNKGHALAITGQPEAVSAAAATLELLWEQAKAGAMLSEADLESALRRGAAPTVADVTGIHSPIGNEYNSGGSFSLRTKKGALNARTARQGIYLQLLQRHEIVFSIGPAGTGKTYLAVAQAVAMLTAGLVDRIVLTRPAVEAGERLGFLPGDMREKIDPYLRPLYDALGDMMGPEQLAKRLEKGEIEIAPLAFMRGRTLQHAYIILDEAQNTLPVQMKMFLTRLGEGARMVITGDPSQVDLPAGQRSGLVDALETLRDVPEIGVIEFASEDVVRHALVGKIVAAYDRTVKKLADRRA